MSDLTVFEEALKNGDIRLTADGKQRAVVDLVMYLTGKDEKSARQTAKRLKSKHLELVSFFDTYSFGPRRPSEVVNAEGAIRLIMVLPGLKAAKFRQDAARLICRYMAADITLADDIIQRNNNPEDQKWMATRMEGKKARRVFTDAIQAHGGTGKVYAEASDINNLAITGKTARALQAERNVKNTRDGLSLTELSGAMLAENLEVNQMDVRDVRGNAQILDVTREVSTAVGEIVRRYGRKEIAVEATVL